MPTNMYSAIITYLYFEYKNPFATTLTQHNSHNANTMAYAQDPAADFKVVRGEDGLFIPSIGADPFAFSDGRRQQWDEWFYFGPGEWRERHDWMDENLRVFRANAVRVLQEAPLPDERNAKRIRLMESAVNPQLEDAAGEPTQALLTDAEPASSAEPAADAEPASGAEPTQCAEQAADAEPAEGAEQAADAEQAEGADAERDADQADSSDSNDLTDPE